MEIYRSVGSTERVDQGDVFQDIYFPAVDGKVSAIVITPTCDLGQTKADFIKFVSVVSLNQIIQIIAQHKGIDDSFFKSGTYLSQRKTKDLLEAFTQNIRGDIFPRYYFLDEYADVFPASFADLQQIFVIPARLLNAEYLDNRIARLVSPWSQEIVARYSGYSMRVGVDAYPEAELRVILAKTGLNLAI